MRLLSMRKHGWLCLMQRTSCESPTFARRSSAVVKLSSRCKIKKITPTVIFFPILNPRPVLSKTKSTQPAFHHRPAAKNVSDSDPNLQPPPHSSLRLRHPFLFPLQFPNPQPHDRSAHLFPRGINYLSRHLLSLPCPGIYLPQHPTPQHRPPTHRRP
ncbi:Protein of unknown function [Pyronema omphalodes CBS 100304]|uniref:Uncharacterized protein n=1 Tax=Pyronema omphalodes (strain CBS 100304) TaxID=1076935 RepID=U4LV53_PYROM|nr:Protein of unknown function [Pyronema omphalodes CBS 100304]